MTNKSLQEVLESFRSQIVHIELGGDPDEILSGKSVIERYSLAIKELIKKEVIPKKKNLTEAPNGSIESALIGYNQAIEEMLNNLERIQ